MTFLLDALKTFQAEGWTDLERQTLLDIVNCYKKLEEKEKVVRTLVQIASFDNVDVSERSGRFKEALDIAKRFGKLLTLHLSDLCIYVNSVREREGLESELYSHCFAF